MIIGRVAEQKRLQDYYESQRPEFVAVYGRRRVGKTYLIKQFFKNNFVFYATGVSNAPKEEQLQNFHDALQQYGGQQRHRPRSWLEAFQQLRQVIDANPTPGKKVIFIDELPWLDTPKSGFIHALELFWNSWADSHPEILLIVCGSASSWMLNELIHSHGGLYNRVTQVIHLEQFSLGECRRFFVENRIIATDYQILEYYMVFGGIPFYLNMLDNSLSVTQNIDALCLANDARLRGEFDELFSSLFKRSKRHEDIVRALASKKSGRTRNELLKAAGLKDGGSFSKALDELQMSGFIRAFVPFGREERGRIYQLMDFYTAFYLRFIEGSDPTQPNAWAIYSATPAHAAWAGLAFEQVCLSHVAQVRHRLGISGMLSAASGWRSEHSKPAVQIDLLLDRSDNVIDLCEIKYLKGEYRLDSAEDLKIKARRNTFIAEVGTKKAVRTVMVTTYGLERNSYSSDYPVEVVATDLFKDDPA